MKLNIITSRDLLECKSYSFPKPRLLKQSIFKYLQVATFFKFWKGQKTHISFKAKCKKNFDNIINNVPNLKKTRNLFFRYNTERIHYLKTLQTFLTT